MIRMYLFIAQARIPPGHVFISVDLYVCGCMGLKIWKAFRPEGLLVLLVCRFVGFACVWVCGVAGFDENL